MLQREQGPPPCGGILATDTGFGKTHVIAALVKQHELWPTLIAVPKDLMEQWIEVLNAAGLGGDLRAVVEGKQAPSANSRKLVLTTVSLLQTKPPLAMPPSKPACLLPAPTTKDSSQVDAAALYPASTLLYYLWYSIPLETPLRKQR
jgi:hypothetical protein